MTVTELKSIGEDVLAEYLPKTKAADRTEALKAFVEELKAQGLDIEEDEDPDDGSGEPEEVEEPWGGDLVD